MTTIVKRTTPALLTAFCLAFAVASAEAQQRIAVVNLKTVFDGFWKTKQSDKTVKERQAEFQTERTKMTEDYQKANEEYRKLTEGASDPAVSAEERERRKKSAETKLLEIKEIEQSIAQFERQFRVQVADQIKRMREGILRQIQDVVDTKARAGGYALVIDTAALSANQTPIVLYTGTMPDMTQEILKELNAKAPPGSLTDSK